MTAPDLLQDFLIKRAEGQAWKIKVLADCLVKEMQRAHGCTYCAGIDHQRGVVIVRPA